MALASACSTSTGIPLADSENDASAASSDGSTLATVGRQLVGRDGGTVKWGAVRVEIPPGALIDTTEIVIRSTSRTIADASVDFRLESDAYTFEPSGLHFALPVVVTFEAPAATPGTTLFWSAENPDDGYEPIETVREGNSIGGSVTHFSDGFLAAPFDALVDLLVPLRAWCDAHKSGHRDQPCCVGLCDDATICINGRCEGVECKRSEQCDCKGDDDQCPATSSDSPCEYPEGACALTGSSVHTEWKRTCSAHTCVDDESTKVSYAKACIRGVADLPPQCCRGLGVQCPHECCVNPPSAECDGTINSLIRYGGTPTCSPSGFCKFEVTSSDPCPPGSTCLDAQCRCNAGLMSCGTACVDTLSDREHCNGCLPCGGFNSDSCNNGACSFRHTCNNGVCTPQPAYFWALYANGPQDSPGRYVTVVLDGKTFGPWGTNVGSYTPLGASNPPITVGDHVVTISVDGPTNRSFWFTPVTVWAPTYYAATSGFELLDASGAPLANYPVSFAGVTSKSFIGRVR